jgi:hypothetical protein
MLARAKGNRRDLAILTPLVDSGPAGRVAAVTLGDTDCHSGTVTDHATIGPEGVGRNVVPRNVAGGLLGCRPRRRVRPRREHRRSAVLDRVDGAAGRLPQLVGVALFRLGLARPDAVQVDGDLAIGERAERGRPAEAVVAAVLEAESDHEVGGIGGQGWHRGRAPARHRGAHRLALAR